MVLDMMLLNRIGENLFGDDWKSPLAHYLEVDERTMRRWVNGSKDLPKGVWKELFIKLDVKRDEVNFLIEKVKEKIDV